MPGATAAGRWVDVAPERLAGWLDRFAGRHGSSIADTTADITASNTANDSTSDTAAVSGPGFAAEAVTYRAGDGSVAECHPPFPPLEGRPGGESGEQPGPAELAAQMVRHAERDRTVGVLLVRLGGYAAGVFAGSPPRLVDSKTGSRLVHGRSAAGGQSQQRFARRREKQAGEALAAAAGTAAAVFGRYRGRLDAVVLGGDRRAIAAITADPRLGTDLRPYLDLAVDRFLTVPDPRLRVLQQAPQMFQAIRIRVLEAPDKASIAAKRGAQRRRAPGNTDSVG